MKEVDIKTLLNNSLTITTDMYNLLKLYYDLGIQVYEDKEANFLINNKKEINNYIKIAKHDFI